MLTDSEFQALLGVSLCWAQVGFWHFGHDFYGPRYQLIVVVAMLCNIVLELLGYLCPPEAIPFQSTLKYTAVLGVQTFSILSLSLCPLSLSFSR